MSEYKEQHPLLYESDEESRPSWSEKYRRARHPYGAGRARARVKGAALIIKQWPDHLASLWIYWWTGFAMIAIMVFIIYNIVFLVDVATPNAPVVQPNRTGSSNKPNRVYKENIYNADQEIYMHVFVNSYEDTKEDFYLKYTKRFAKKFKGYRYNLIVVLNDMQQSLEKDLSAETNNNIALKSILNGDKIYHSVNNILVTYISHSNYLDNSPVKSFWRHLPLYIQKFLTRCITIWDKGGIAFDPIVITPLSPNANYMGNIRNILKHKKLKNNPNRLQDKEITRTIRPLRKQNPRVNNIQDIINILESNNTSANIPQYNLTEADNMENIYYIKTTNNREMQNSKLFKREIIMNNVTNNNETLLEINETTHLITITKDNSHKQITGPTKDDKTSQIHDMLNKNLDIVTAVDQSESVDYIKVKQNSSARDSSIERENIGNTKLKLIIDLKGNIIASKTPCHAFIGSIFNHLRHYSYNDSLETVITDEILLFCNGTLRSCKYIDVILV